jgi:DUF4097 and DUF4098 domain-containing protein YvlB
MKKSTSVVFSMSLLAISLLSNQVLAAAIEVNEQRKVQTNEKIYIENLRGQVDIVATDKTEFSVKGQLDEKAEGFELTSKDGFTRFIVKMPQKQYNWRSEDNNTQGSQLQIEVPKGTALEFSGVNSAVKVSGVQGSSKIQTVNGHIQTKQLANEVVLETVNGEITSVDSNGRIKLNTVNGEINDQGSRGRLDAEAVNGEISLQSSASEVNVSVVNGEVNMQLSGTERLEFSSVNGEISVELQNSASPKISASSVSGDLTLKLTSATNARFSLETNGGGDISNKLTEQKAEKTKYGPGRSLEFNLGSGEGRVEMTTVSGDLTIENL